MRYWWVNHKKTHKHEIAGGYLWAPKLQRNGRANQYYENMRELLPGDLVFSYANGEIKAVGLVLNACESAPKPTEFGKAGEDWDDEGWFAPVDFQPLQHPMRPKDHIGIIAPLLPSKYSPLKPSGDGNEAYLAGISEECGRAVLQLLGNQVTIVSSDKQSNLMQADIQEQSRIQKAENIPATIKRQLVDARVGQGLFRSRVELVEPSCRITNISDRRFLIASHIKPWSQSSDIEKLDGNNGLLLSPHVDHLFDRGYISFQDNGALLLSSDLPTQIASALHVTPLPVAVRPLNPQQCEYMRYHRQSIFRTNA